MNRWIFFVNQTETLLSLEYYCDERPRRCWTSTIIPRIHQHGYPELHAQSWSFGQASWCTRMPRKIQRGCLFRSRLRQGAWARLVSVVILLYLVISSSSFWQLLTRPSQLMRLSHWSATHFSLSITTVPSLARATRQRTNLIVRSITRFASHSSALARNQLLQLTSF